ncbi:cytochrome P450 [Streptomyces sp. NPDC002004]
MTTPSHPFSGTDEPALVPPPGCPAHGQGRGGARRLYGPEADHDLAGVYEKLRAEHGAVAPALLHNDVPIWVVLGYAENLQLVNSPATFNRDSRNWNALREGLVAPDHPLAPVFAWQPICAFAEGAEHKRLRGAVTAAMKSLSPRTLRRHLNESCQGVINDICLKGSAELVTEFAEQLPMAVMCRILGMPEEYNERLVQAARDMIKGTETAIASNEYVMSVLFRLVARLRAQPDDGFTSAMLAHESRLTDDEVAQHLRLVLIAAYEATANLIANVLRVVFTDPGFRAQLKGGQMTVPEAVEQSLWNEPPFSAMIGYFAKRDTELGGRNIRRGDGLIFGIAPGNVDPAVRPDLEASMLGNQSHLAFGGGIHECPGQNIGRAIADSGIDALLLRLPDIRLSIGEEELSWKSTILSRHLVELPVAFEPQPRQDVTAKPSFGNEPPPRKLEWTIAEPARSGTPNPVPPAPVAPPVQPDPAPVRLGRWQRFLRWWRGY